MASLSYAAAWIADLPELRDLRSFFNSKYGNSIESYVNKEVRMILLLLTITSFLFVRISQLTENVFFIVCGEIKDTATIKRD